MAVTTRLTAAGYEALRRHHLDPAVQRERISYAFGRAVYGRRGLESVLIADPPILPADDCYVSQAGGHVALDPAVLNAILAKFAATDCDTIVNVHDHWFSSGGTNFSSIDANDEQSLARYLRRRFEPMLQRRPDIGRPREVVSLALVLDQSGLAARYVDRRGHFRPVDRIEIIGPIARRIIPNGSSLPKNAQGECHARQRDFINPTQQAYLADTTFAVVGCGGLGSIVAEALLRVGASRFTLFDPDDLEPHNLNRWQGGRPADIGSNKAQLVARRLRSMAGRDRVHVEVVPLSVLAPEALPSLKRADVVVGCLDNHLARYFLNRFSVQYMVPYFDAGVNIAASDVVDFQSRFFAVVPAETACAECTAYDLIDRREVDRDLMDQVTADSRRSAGYVENRPEITAAASAYALNLRAASTLSTELLNWVCGHRPLATAVAEFWATGRHQRSDRANHPEAPDPRCPVCAQLLGAGDHAELPRPQPQGHAARILAEARVRALSAFPPP
jgi:molybdopterin/thiamine biosynthesis adenylyltransferase